MTCKDCVHYEVCVVRASQFKSVGVEVEWDEEDSADVCMMARKKSRFVELPCEVGQTVYKITRNKVKECEVVFVGISADEKCSYFNFVEKYADGTFYKSYSMVFDVIGKTVFLSREEAEKALKERRSDGLY